MEYPCRICKNPGTVVVNVTDPKTGKKSEMVCLCDDCLEKVSKARKVEIVDRFTASADKSASEEEKEEPIPLYLRNVQRICSFFEILIVVGVIVALIAGLVFITALTNGGVVVAYISAPTLIVGIALIIRSHIQKLVVEAVEDYLNRHK